MCIIRKSNLNIISHNSGVCRLFASGSNIYFVLEFSDVQHALCVIELAKNKCYEIKKDYCFTEKHMAFLNNIIRQYNCQ